MADAPQIYLTTPAAFELSSFPLLLARLLDAVPVACVRMSLATQDSDAVMRAGDALRDVAHARDVAMLIGDHYRVVKRLGLDGVHLTDPRELRNAREEIGKDGIVGCHCGASRHTGLNAAEAGATYVAFGPLGASDLGGNVVADRELFLWWAEMIEIPVVAEGGIDETVLAELRDHLDFVAVGAEVFSAPDPVSKLGNIQRLLGPAEN